MPSGLRITLVDLIPVHHLRHGRRSSTTSPRLTKIWPAASKIMAPLRRWRVSVPHCISKTDVSDEAIRRLGGMCGAIVTSPFDVVKTRLQSDLFRSKHGGGGVGGVVMEGNGVAAVAVRRNLLWHFVETAHIIRCVRPLILPLPSHLKCKQGYIS